VLVGVDTGLTHMGTALGVPTVALFGSTRPYLHTDSPATRVVYEPLWCSPCRRNPVCGGEFSCMRLHRPRGVMAAIEQVLESVA
jgi:heptosyltransferase-1